MRPALMLSKRARAKSSVMYDNSTWDLGDAVAKGKVNIDTLKNNELPVILRKMKKEQRKKYVHEKINARIKIKKKIVALTKKRDKYIANKRKEESKPSVNTMNEAVIKAIQKQGALKNYRFNN